MSAHNATGGGGSANGQTPSKPSKEKRVSDKDVDLSNKQRGVWLGKVPKYISDRWKKAKDKSELGKLRITRRPGMGKPQIDFTLDEKVAAARTDGTGDDDDDRTKSGSTSRAIPREHKFVVSHVASQSLAVFSLQAGDPEAVVPVPDKLSMEGKVVQRAECRPISDKTYMSLKKEALVRAIEPVRQTIQLDKAVVNFKPIANHAANIEYEARKKAEGKKSRDDKGRVVDRLFALFEKHQYYKMIDLVKETRQPVPYLKEILKEYCVYNTKAPHKSMWELKPEYRHYKVDAEEAEGAEKEEEDSDSD